MSGENAVQISTAKRVACTIAPLKVATIDFVKSLTEGKTVKESAKDE